MGTLSADLDEMALVSQTLHQLAGQVAGEKVTGTGGVSVLAGGADAACSLYGPGGGLPAVQALLDVVQHLIEGDLVPAVRERLKTTGDVMTDVAKAYRAHDDDVAGFLSAYRNALGDWSVQVNP